MRTAVRTHVSRITLPLRVPGSAGPGPEGDLFEWCFRPTVPAPGVEREAHMRPIVAQLLVAVRWLHGLGIAHRDLSLENVLLEDSGAELRVKLIDFGMATMKRKVRSVSPKSK